MFKKGLEIKIRRQLLVFLEIINDKKQKNELNRRKSSNSIIICRY